jgi:ABC-2 type transport system permease protein
MAASVAKRLPKLLRLWALGARMDLLFLSRSLRTALAWYVSDLLVGLSGAVWAFLLAERFDGIGPWGRTQVVFLLGFALLVRGVVDTVFNMNIAFPSRRIGRGQLDHMLLMPQPLWLTIASDGFAPVSSSGQLLVGAGVLAWAAHALALPIDLAWLALLLLHVGSASAIVVSFAYLWGSLAFVAPRGAEEINSNTMRMLEQLKPFPLDGVGAALAGGLVTFVPAGLLAWLPARVLLGMETSAGAWLWTPSAALGFAALATFAFRRGLRRYGRTGSVRYLSHGHRR